MMIYFDELWFKGGYLLTKQCCQSVRHRRYVAHFEEERRKIYVGLTDLTDDGEEKTDCLSTPAFWDKVTFFK